MKFDSLAEQRINKKGLTERRFREFRKVYLTYPQLAAPVMEYLDIHAVAIRRAVTAELQTIELGGVLTNQLCRTILHQ